MYSDKFKKFIEIWRREFAIEKSMNEQICADKNGLPLPWYTYPAIEYLSQFDYREKDIFEYGCGYSSAFWAARARKVVSVEDNPSYYKRWQTEFAGLKNWQLLRREDNEAYEQAIEEVEIRFDVIAIDGKRRAKCAEAALRGLKDGGMIILDDSDRVNNSAEYAQAIGLLRDAGLLQVDFYGFCPLNNYPKTTSLFLRRDFNFATKNLLQPANGIGNLWSLGRRRRKEFVKSNLAAEVETLSKN